MAEYALIVNGQFEKIHNFESAPLDIPHKQIVWLPVERETESHDPNTQELSLQFDHVVEQNRLLAIRRARNISRERMIENIITEREIRLAGGFDYDFGDARGIHRIGTTEQDMKGWDEVTKAATSLVALGLSNQTINIVTNTGPVQVTALEWHQIIIAATNFRQPIWSGSFTLQVQDPIPSDYKNNSWWE